MIFHNKTHTILIILYGMIVALAVWGLLAQTSDQARLPIEIWAAIGAVGACGAMLEILLHLRTRQSLQLMKSQIRKLSENAEIGLVMVPEQWTVEGLGEILNRYLILLGDKFNELRREQKELDLLIQAIDAEKQNTEAIIHSISDAVLVVNRFGELILANAPAENIFHFSLASDRLRPIEDLIDDPRLLAMLDPTRWDKKEPVRFDFELKGSEREKVSCFIVTISPVCIRSRGLWAIVMILHDVTQERALAQMKNDFVNHVSHELRTPLSSIKAYIELLLDGDIKTADGRTDFYKIIQSEADRLDGFIANLLNLSRIESGLMSVEFSRLSLAEEISQSAAQVRYIAEEKSISIHMTLPDKNLTVQADRDLLRQVILNLLSNAIKYTLPGGTISLSAEVDTAGGYYRIRIQDTGIGIEASEMGKIFDQFYRSADGRLCSGGTGLGLSLVKKVVEQIHHGRVEVESVPGRGSTFTVQLPLIPEASGSNHKPQEVLAV